MTAQAILMCSPTHFEVSYEINPWMANQIGNVNKSLAHQQWETLHKALTEVTDVVVLEGVDQLPDLVFTANAGLIAGDKAILSKFAKKERQPEETHFKQWFEEQGYTVVQPTADYEGEGDHLQDSLGRYWLGTGFRTHKQAALELDGFLNTSNHVVELVNPNWYHLDTCFCPLPGGELMWYPKAFSESSQQKIRAAFKKTIDVSEADAKAFCCNATIIGRNIFLPQNESASQALQSFGYQTHEFDFSEFLKSGGAAKCLVLKC